MVREGNIELDLNEGLWKSGWFWLHLFVGAPILGMVAGYTLDGALGWLVGLVLFFGGPVGAIAGLVYVHKNKEEALEIGLDTVKTEAAEIARIDGDENEQFTLITEDGSSLPLLPAPKRNDDGGRRKSTPRPRQGSS